MGTNSYPIGRYVGQQSSMAQVEWDTREGRGFNIINLYAPNSHAERCVLWETMLRELPRHC